MVGGWLTMVFVDVSRWSFQIQWRDCQKIKEILSLKDRTDKLVPNCLA